MIDLLKIQPFIILLLVISQLSNYTILTIIVPISTSLLQAFKYACFLLPIIFLFKGFKLEWRFLLMFVVFSTTLIINTIDAKFNSNLRFLTWILMVSMIGPLFYSYYLNQFKDKLFITFLTTFMIMGALSFFYWLFGFPSLGRGHFSGLFNHSMVLAPIASLGAIYGLYKAYSSDTLKFKIIFSILFIFNLFSVLLASSRSALAGLFLAIFIFIIFAKISYKKIIISIMLLTGIIMNTVVINTLENSSLTQKMASRGIDNTREILWHDRLLEFGSNPYFGVGFASQDDNIQGKIGKKGSDEGTIEPGSTYLMILSMTGILGAFSLFIFFSKYLLSRTFFENNLYTINHKIMIFIFFLVHFIAEGYIFSSGSLLAFIFWLLVAITYPNQFNNRKNSK